MKQRLWFFWRLLPALALVVSTSASAQLELSSATFDGGGGTSSGGGFEVSGTAGQFDAGMHSGGSFDLESGFWNSLNPAVPVELQRFEIVSNPVANGWALAADWPSCRQNAGPPLEVARRDAAVLDRATAVPVAVEAQRSARRRVVSDRSDLEAR